MHLMYLNTTIQHIAIKKLTLFYENNIKEMGYIDVIYVKFIRVDGKVVV